ncbi:MAG TPA: hypothetical protein VG435_14070 [Acidimicrobiales bacterium]|nr:hypothetical protein [Acidimicrobiales bacterium]
MTVTLWVPSLLALAHACLGGDDHRRGRDPHVQRGRVPVRDHGPDRRSYGNETRSMDAW